MPSEAFPTRVAYESFRSLAFQYTYREINTQGIMRVRNPKYITTKQGTFFAKAKVKIKLKEYGDWRLICEEHATKDATLWVVKGVLEKSHRNNVGF